MRMGGRILAVYDIMGHVGALYVPASGASLVLVECVFELVCWAGPCVLSITSCVFDISGTPTMIHLSLQDGWTAVMRASRAGHMECVKVLLDMGAEVNIQDKVSGVIIDSSHAMRHVPRVPSSE